MKRSGCWLLATGMLLAMSAPAQAQFAVIDVASVTQLVEELQTLEQALATARQQLSQAQSLYQSLTGARGVDRLLTGINRNYLPTDWSEIGAAMNGDGSYPALSESIGVDIAALSVLSDAQLRALSPGRRQDIQAARRSVALGQALAAQALQNSSARFADLQQLIDAIPAAGDEKGILDLQARISAEQTMVQNEQTKLQALYAVAQSTVAATQQQTREEILAGQGNFAARFEPTPP